MINGKKLKASIYTISVIATISAIPAIVISCSTNTIVNSFSITKFANLYGPTNSIDLNFISIKQLSGTNEENDLTYFIKTLTFDETKIATSDSISVKNDFKLTKISKNNEFLIENLTLIENKNALKGNYFIEIEIKKSDAIVDTIKTNFDVNPVNFILKVPTSDELNNSLLTSFDTSQLIDINGLLNEDAFSLIDLEYRENNNEIIQNLKKSYTLTKIDDSKIYQIKANTGVNILKGIYTLNLGINFKIAGLVKTKLVLEIK